MNCISMRILGAHNLKTTNIQLKIIILVVVDEVKLISASEFKPSIPKACLSLGLSQPLSSSSGTTLHSAFLLSHNRYHRQQGPPPVGGHPIISTSCPPRGSPSVCVCDYIRGSSQLALHPSEEPAMFLLWMLQPVFTVPIQ